MDHTLHEPWSYGWIPEARDSKRPVSMFSLCCLMIRLGQWRQRRASQLEEELECLRGAVEEIERLHMLEIAQHNLRIARTKRQMNELVPAVALVPDLLFEIFKHVQSTQCDHYSGQEKFWAWIEVTHVCHQWRVVALQHAGLWNEIYATTSTKVRLHLTHSKESPLKLVYHERRTEDTESSHTVLQELLRGISRAYHLELALQVVWEYMFHDIRHDVISKSLTDGIVALPLLETITFDEVTLDGVSSLVFTSACTNLKSLSLNETRCCLSRGMLQPSLQVLRIRNKGYRHMTVQRLICLLAELPNLRTLEVASWLDRREDANEDSEVRQDGSVHLSYLKELCIDEALEPAIDLLRRLVIPVQAFIRLNLTAIDTDSDPLYLQLSDIVAPTFNVGSEEGIALQIESESGITLRVNKHQQCLYEEWDLADNDTCIVLHIYSPFPRRSRDLNFVEKAVKQLPNLLSRFHTQDVRWLDLDAYFSLSTDMTWLSKTRFPNVEAMSVSQTPAQNLSRILQYQGEDPGQDPAPSFTFFPVLRELELHNVTVPWPHWKQALPSFWDPFVSACTARHAANPSLDVVRICGRTDIGYRLFDLRDAVAEVDDMQAYDYQPQDCAAYRSSSEEDEDSESEDSENSGEDEEDEEDEQDSEEDKDDSDEDKEDSDEDEADSDEDGADSDEDDQDSNEIEENSEAEDVGMAEEASVVGSSEEDIEEGSADHNDSRQVEGADD